MENKIENSSSLFKHEPVTIELGGNTYEIVFDMNAFCELEKIYKSVGNVLKKVLGSGRKEHKVFYKDALIEAADVAVDGQSLALLLTQLDRQNDEESTATVTDTLNILYCGIMRDIAIYNEHDEITGYKISKAASGRCIDLKKIAECNLKIATVMMRDLLPTEAEAKNEAGATEAQEEQA